MTVALPSVATQAAYYTPANIAWNAWRAYNDNPRVRNVVDTVAGRLYNASLSTFGPDSENPAIQSYGQLYRPRVNITQAYNSRTTPLSSSDCYHLKKILPYYVRYRSSFMRTSSRYRRYRRYGRRYRRRRFSRRRYY